jgi:hypothetical protein
MEKHVGVLLVENVLATFVPQHFPRSQQGRHRFQKLLRRGSDPGAQSVRLISPIGLLTTERVREFSFHFAAGVIAVVI